MGNTMIRFFMKDKDPHEYDDILDMPYPYSSPHRRMDPIARANQFAPFAGVGHLDSHDGMEAPAPEEEEFIESPFDDSSYEG